jgi:hypothetical protein
MHPPVDSRIIGPLDALHLAAAGFLTFDGNERLLAEAEGLKVTV